MSHDLLSQASYYLEPRFNGQKLSSATGFITSHNGKRYLITNWHVVSGKNSESKKHLSKSLAEPNELKINIFKNQSHIEPFELVVPLLDANGRKMWMEHPKYGSDVDVIALEIEIPDSALAFDLESYIEPFNEETSPYVRGDVYVIGYPFGLVINNIFPIWKRASVASEPTLDLNGLPKFFIDTATRSGMSGSPVVLYEKRPITFLGKNDKGEEIASRNLMNLCGIYSGRIGAEDELKAQLGLVWKFAAVKEILTQ